MQYMEISTDLEGCLLEVDKMGVRGFSVEIWAMQLPCKVIITVL